MMNKAFRGADNVPFIEDLGTGSFYFNFNVVREVITNKEGEEEVKHSYNQVRCDYPEDLGDLKETIKEALKVEGFEITKELNSYIDENIKGYEYI